jgi:hypothetical protein
LTEKEVSGCELFVGFDRYQDWHAITSMMIWREGVAGSEADRALTSGSFMPFEQMGADGKPAQA